MSQGGTQCGPLGRSSDTRLKPGRPLLGTLLATVTLFENPAWSSLLGTLPPTPCQSPTVTPAGDPPSCPPGAVQHTSQAPPRGHQISHNNL